MAMNPSNSSGPLKLGKELSKSGMKDNQLNIPKRVQSNTKGKAMLLKHFFFT